MPKARDQRPVNHRLRDTITAAGVSYDRVARTVAGVAAEHGETLRTNKSAVAHWVAGTEPSERTARYLAEALSRLAGRPVTLEELGFAADIAPDLMSMQPVETSILLGRADVENRPFLAAAVYTAVAVAMPLHYDHEPVARLLRARTGRVRVGAEDVAVVRQITRAFSMADEILGGGHGLSTVATYLADTAAPMLSGRFPSEGTRRDAFSAAAELAWLLGWKHHDLGHNGTAQRYYLLGFQFAVEADPHAHAAWMMRAIAQQALSLKQSIHSRDLAQGAIDRARGFADGSTQALLNITLARANAALGDRPAAARALLAAEDNLAKGDAPQPGYSRLMGPATGAVASHTARTLTEIGDHVGAERQHRAAFTSWDPIAFPRVHLLTNMDLGDCLAAQARADEAVAAWSQALDLAEGMASSRTRSALASVRSTLGLYRRRGVPGAAALLQRLQPALI
ncbi:tetratricopeptide repeat protein [Spongiactinospora rosea]|uniref:Tetratricopeptide repeat protein n=1 Tax=Spongiactinospora rosea TaxID=2248750 RepID=A0A366LUG3_9ACTN|nr:tetratricopeptide repeat protein [Spongiactinospora rosea]RBQ16944.1 tetratricopeptide repeat protein [Spongiactinospora rosea]